MKILVFSDMHISPDAAYSYTLKTGLTTHLLRIENTFEWIAELIKKYRPRLVVNGGDLFETTGFVQTASLHVAHKGLTSLQAAFESVGGQPCSFIHLVGNHDRSTDFLHSISWTENHKQEVIDKFGIYAFGGSTPGKVGLVSWADVKETKKWLKENPTDVVISHVSIMGCPMDISGVEIGIDSFLPTDFNAPVVLAGHYHRPSDPFPGIHVIGSTITRNFRDTVNPDQHGVIIYDIDTKEVIRERNPWAIKFQEYVAKDEADLLLILGAFPDTTGRQNVALKLTHPQDQTPLVEALFTGFACMVKNPVVEEKQRKSSISLMAPAKDNLNTYLSSSDREGIDSAKLTAIVEAGLSTYQGKVREGKSIKFKSMQVENFLSLGKIELAYSNSGIIHVKGSNLDQAKATSNGGGKSALVCDSPYWILTGDTLTRPTRGDDVINDSSPGGTLGTLQLEVNGQPYLIQRARKHLVHGDKLQVTKADGKIQNRLNKHRQKVLDEDFGPGFEEFLLQSVFIRESISGGFSSLTYSKRAAVLETYLDTSLYDSFNSYVVENTIRLASEITKAAGDKLLTDTSIVRVRAEISRIMSDIETWQARHVSELAEVTRLIKEKQDKILEVKQSAVQLRGAFAIAKEAVDKNKQDVDKASKELVTLNSESLPTRTQIAVFDEKIKSALHLRAMGKCSVCGSDLTTLNLDVQAAAYQTERDQLALGYQKMIEVINQKSEEVRGLSTKQASLAATANKVSTELTQADTFVTVACSSLAEYQARRQKLDTEIPPLNDSLAQLDKEHLTLTTKVTLLAAEVERLNEDMRAYGWWKAHMTSKGFKSYLLDQLVLYINSILTDLSRYLFEEGTVRLSTTRELKSGEERNEVYIELTGFRDIALASSGERRRVDILLQIALAIAASKLSVFDCNIIVFDEVFDRLDATGLESVLKLLENLAESKQVIMTSHNPIISNAVTQQITVAKSNGVSYITNT